MVKSKEKEPTMGERLKAQIEQINKDNPIIKTRYYVDEVTPAYRDHDGYDYVLVKEARSRVSPMFSSRDKAVRWLEAHLPDEGNRLEVMKQHLRRTVTERWWSPSRA